LNKFPTARYSSRSDTYYDAMTRLFDMAVDLDVCVLMTAQLKREAEGPKKRPSNIDQLADCKGAGDVATNVLYLYRPEKYPQHSEDLNFQGWIEIIPVALRKGLEKDRNFRLNFNRQTSLITDYSQT
jgi:hypothetical protein